MFFKKSDNVMKIEQVPINDLKPAEYNLRKLVVVLLREILKLRENSLIYYKRNGEIRLLKEIVELVDHMG